ncbi:MAG TPA: 16S rRNA (cytosine(1402)-N(4))-methyltransferase RsmH [Ignavibacteriales bacterium]|nr:16S rRNA (cytosine(1402)-N(4))-methyltransferase RsmH [Ignavibacteriales bacterium]
MSEEIHVPVLLKESLEFLITDTSGIYFDGTAGFGGHSAAILKQLDWSGKLVLTDMDATAFEYCKSKFGGDGRVSLYNFNFAQIDIISKLESISGYTGIFVDLGVSSFQLDDAEAGFTYRTNSPLDLRMDKNAELSAKDVVNTFDEKELADIFFQYGEEKNSRKIARAIVEKRNAGRIETTLDLAKIVEGLTPAHLVNKSLSRVFQALRIYVNDELGSLKDFLNKAVSLLDKKGRIVVLSYHSLEDRIVKDVFKYENLSCVCPPGLPVCQCGKEQRLKILTKKPLAPQESEIKNNKRARSAKLRAAERI